MGVTVHGPGDWLIFRPVRFFPPLAADGRKMCLSAWTEGDSFRGEKGVSKTPQPPRRENWDSPL